VADLDADGDLDLASLNEMTNDLTIYFQTGPRQFDGPLRLGGAGVIDGGGAFEAVDLEGDGDVDLLCTGAAFGPQLTLFRQEGGGTFAAPVGIGAQVFISSFGLDVIDLDADGALDIVLGPNEGPIVFYQASDGSFEAPVLLAPGLISRSIADLDGDGRLDVMATGRTDGPARVLYQLAPRTFTAPHVLAPAAEFLSSPHDLDADGDLDFVVQQSTAFSVLFQLAPRRFSTLRPIEGSLFLDAADLDADGDLDIVGRGASPNEIVVHWGGR
jgi:hypothetical protein